MTDETGAQLDSQIRAMLDSCEAVLDAEAHRRARAIRYYNGEVPDIDKDLSRDEGSPAPLVISPVRERIRMLMPAVMRTMFSSDDFVKYIPPSPEDDYAAEAASKYVNRGLYQTREFRKAIHDSIFDALLLRTGILRWEAVDESVVNVTDFSNQTLEMLEAIRAEGNEVTDVEEHDDGTYSFSVQEVAERTAINLVCIPRDDFLIFAEAEDIDDSPLVGHRAFVTRAELLDAGYDSEVVMGLPSLYDRRDEEVEPRPVQGGLLQHQL